MFRWSACLFQDAKTQRTILVRLVAFQTSLYDVLLSSGVKLTNYECSATLYLTVEKAL